VNDSKNFHGDVLGFVEKFWLKQQQAAVMDDEQPRRQRDVASDWFSVFASAVNSLGSVEKLIRERGVVATIKFVRKFYV